MGEKVESHKRELIDKLREIFQFPYADLDFGIYKVYKYKRDSIEKFLDKSNKSEEKPKDSFKSIDEIIDEKFSELVLGEIKSVEEEFERERNELLAFLGDESQLEDEEFLNSFQKGKQFLNIKRKYEELKKQAELSEEIKINIYNHLYQFFRKYYKDGDFIPLRRWGKDKHIVFYNGQEVFFYWATKDMYYIKSGEIFKEYRFENKVKVMFKLQEVQDTKGNQKTDKKYFFFKNLEISRAKDEITIYFEYRELSDKEKEVFRRIRNVQEAINEKTKEILKEKLSEFEWLLKEEKPGIFYHLNRFTHKNKYDFFIHKNLKEFLTTELDFYIKNNVLYLEDLKLIGDNLKNVQFYLNEAEVIYKIGMQIIEFLSTLEDFQKRLWEKPKFVIDTHYVITLNKLKEILSNDDFEKVLDEILNNGKQVEEWKKLGFFEQNEEVNKASVFKNGDEALFEEKEVKPLPVDTKNFNGNFKWKLLNLLSKNGDFNLDETLDGILIKSDNWQALNLLKHKYRNEIKTIYIDPPYNSKSSEIIYKNGYRDSSWITLMENRLRLGKKLLSDDGSITVAIDDYEFHNLKYIMDFVYGKTNHVSNICVVHNPGGRSDDKFFATAHEYAVVYAKNIDSLELKGLLKEVKKGDKQKIQFRRTGSNSTPDARPNLFYPIYFNPVTKEISLEKKKNFVEILPIDSKGVERV